MSEEIEQLIHSHSGVVVVHLAEPVLGADPEMERAAREVARWRANITLIHGVFSLHREWARKYRVHGSPSTLVFREGRLCVRLKGRCGCAQLREALERAGLLAPPE